ncbi:MAG TPA: DUF3619 family protein [Rhodoferax sp.]|jgi:hypothetical protein|nr:DUF3619 family protein [Rhodoferax sp.]
MTNSTQQQAGIFEDRFGRQIAARLSEGAADLPHDISERLRVSRAQALARRKVIRTQTAAVVASSAGDATLAFGNEGLSWWGRIAAALPIVALAIGMVAINVVQDNSRTVEVAKVDTALLTDDLPPAAYTDPGFLQYLHSSKDLTQ